jgi:hypothetical protein
MAMIFNPFRMQKPKQFNYMPLYYDERKEKLKKMQEEANAKKDGVPRVNLRRGFLTEERSRRRTQLVKGSLIRWTVILVTMILFFWILFPRIDKFVILLTQQAR